MSFGMVLPGKKKGNPKSASSVQLGCFGADTAASKEVRQHFYATSGREFNGRKGLPTRSLSEVYLPPPYSRPEASASTPDESKLHLPSELAAAAAKKDVMEGGVAGMDTYALAEIALEPEGFVCPGKGVKRIPLPDSNIMGARNSVGARKSEERARLFFTTSGREMAGVKEYPSRSMNEVYGPTFAHKQALLWNARQLEREQSCPASASSVAAAPAGSKARESKSALQLVKTSYNEAFVPASKERLMRNALIKPSSLVKFAKTRDSVGDPQKKSSQGACDFFYPTRAQMKELERKCYRTFAEA